MPIHRFYYLWRRGDPRNNPPWIPRGNQVLGKWKIVCTFSAVWGSACPQPSCCSRVNCSYFLKHKLPYFQEQGVQYVKDAICRVRIGLLFILHPCLFPLFPLKFRQEVNGTQEFEKSGFIFRETFPKDLIYPDSLRCQTLLTHRTRVSTLQRKQNL